MNKKIYIIANWKMQLLDSEAEELSADLVKEINSKENLEIVLCPSFTALNKIKKDKIKLGSQNVYHHEKGAYTGEISPSQLKELDVEFVILGHSERRQYLKETDEDVNKKVHACLRNNLIPIICVGETFDERRENQTDLVLMRQVLAAFKDVEVKENKKIIVAYEPVWVIGTGQAIQPRDAEKARQVIYQALLDLFEPEFVKNNISIIYGGSIDAENVKDFVSDDKFDGVLIGGASLDKNKFLNIINKF